MYMYMWNTNMAPYNAYDNSDVEITPELQSTLPDESALPPLKLTGRLLPQPKSSVRRSLAQPLAAEPRPRREPPKASIEHSSCEAETVSKVHDEMPPTVTPLLSSDESDNIFALMAGPNFDMNARIMCPQVLAAFKIRPQVGPFYDYELPLGSMCALRAHLW